MSWCGNCFASLSDTEIETDGEYEYIADSNYICKRVKTPPINPADELGKGEDVISSISRPTSSELPSAPSLPSGKEPAIAKESQVQQVGHAIICSRCPKLVKDIKKSDQAVQIDMKPCPAGKHQREKPAKNKKSSSHPLKSTSSSASVNSPKKDRPAVRQWKPQKLMQRIFGQSHKNVHYADDHGEHQCSKFNELTEFSRPSVTTTTTTVFWTVRVTKK